MDMKLHRWHLALILGCLMGLLPTQRSRADDSPYLFGDWNGERTRLADAGIVFDLGYSSEAAHNFSGGTSHLTRYTDQWKLGAKFDLDKLWGWKGGTFLFTVTDRNGRNLGADANIGNYQLIQEVYGRGQTWWLTFFALDQTFLDGKIDIRVGRMPAGEDFGSFTCDFENLTFCGAPAGNLAGDYWLNWPIGVWAARVKVRTTDETYVQLGAYQINPKYVDTNWEEANGWKLNFPGGTTGALMPLEFGWTPKLSGMPGSYKVGGWYNNAGGSDLYYDVNHEPLALTDGEPLQRSARHGEYLSIQQQVSGDAGSNGATVFFNATHADSNTTATDRQFALGMEYKGVFGRPNDFIGTAIGATHGSSREAAYQRLYNELNPDTPIPVQDGYEYVAEVFYNWAPLPSINLRPNLQYILHPGGTSQNSNAFVLGLKTVIAF